MAVCITVAQRPTCLRILSPRSRLARETALIDLEVDCVYQPYVCRYSVAGTERDNVTGDKFVREHRGSLAVSASCERDFTGSVNM